MMLYKKELQTNTNKERKTVFFYQNESAKKKEGGDSFSLFFLVLAKLFKLRMWWPWFIHYKHQYHSYLKTDSLVVTKSWCIKHSNLFLLKKTTTSPTISKFFSIKSSRTRNPVLPAQIQTDGFSNSGIDYKGTESKENNRIKFHIFFYKVKRKSFFLKKKESLYVKTGSSL